MITGAITIYVFIGILLTAKNDDTVRRAVIDGTKGNSNTRKYVVFFITVLSSVFLWPKFYL